MENFITILEFLAAIAAGVATALPLISKLLKTVDELRRSRNWGNLLGIVTDLMAEAENQLNAGTDKKAFVLAGVETLASSVDYEIDMDELSELIDSLCEMSKKVNFKEV